MILNKSQAQAVFDAMCALNNVNGSITASFEDIQVWGTMSNFIYVYKVTDSDDELNEIYNSQAEFAGAYELLL